MGRLIPLCLDTAGDRRPPGLISELISYILLPLDRVRLAVSLCLHFQLHIYHTVILFTIILYSYSTIELYCLEHYGSPLLELVLDP